jgi:hypothetical protein
MKTTLKWEKKICGGYIWYFISVHWNHLKAFPILWDYPFNAVNKTILNRHYHEIVDPKQLPLGHWLSPWNVLILTIFFQISFLYQLISDGNVTGKLLSQKEYAISVGRKRVKIQFYTYSRRKMEKRMTNKKGKLFSHSFQK